jgi:phage gpG-like protein
MIRQVGRWFGIAGIADDELKKLRKPAERAILKASIRYERAVKLVLKGPRTGRMYGDHQASAPGEPPALLTGALRNSITHTMPEWDEDNAVTAEVGTSLVYAAILEWGGVAGNNARILPRPYMEPTFLAMQDELESILKEAVES